MKVSVYEHILEIGALDTRVTMLLKTKKVLLAEMLD